MFGKQTQTAIAAMSRLAEVYDEGATRISAADIAENRDLQRPIVAKILTVLSQANLVGGSPGPGGGYVLARDPKEIALYDVFRLFEREDESVDCPYGGGVCGVGEPCALHDKLVHMQETVNNFMKKTTFEGFRIAFQDEHRKPTPKEEGMSVSQRKSYRATRVKRW